MRFDVVIREAADPVFPLEVFLQVFVVVAREEIPEPRPHVVVLRFPPGLRLDEIVAKPLQRRVVAAEIFERDEFFKGGDGFPGDFQILLRDRVPDHLRRGEAVRRDVGRRHADADQRSMRVELKGGHLPDRRAHVLRGGNRSGAYECEAGNNYGGERADVHSGAVVEILSAVKLGQSIPAHRCSCPHDWARVTPVGVTERNKAGKTTRRTPLANAVASREAPAESLEPNVSAVAHFQNRGHSEGA